MASRNLLVNKMFVNTDKNTNNYLISILLEFIFFESKSNYNCNLETTFICKNDSYNIYRYNNTIDFDTLSKSAYYLDYYNSDISNNTPYFKSMYIKSILIQMADMFDILKKYNFTHNNLTYNNIKFKINTSGPDVKINILLKDYYNSTINYNDITVSNPDIKSKLYLKNITTMSNIDYTKYKFNYNNGLKILHLRRFGFPIYIGTFDFYTLLISLCTNLSFYNGFIIDDYLYVFWKQLWSPDDFAIITVRLLEYHQNSSNTDITIEKCIELLSGLTLKSDILNFVKTNLN